MTEIPEDVWTISESVWEELSGLSAASHRDASIEIIARAILADRERILNILAEQIRAPLDHTIERRVRRLEWILGVPEQDAPVDFTPAYPKPSA